MFRMNAMSSRAAGNRGFSLIELLVVIIIIALVIGILLPALRGARQTSRAASTQALMKDLATASQSFRLSNRRDPGYFTPIEMGDTGNITRGMSGMQNVLLDLSGGFTSATGAGVLTGLGPTTGTVINVDVSLIGSIKSGSTGPGGYFTPDKRNFSAQSSPGQRESSIQGHIDLPELVDAFGQPVLVWTADERRSDRFVGVNSTQAAKFYWAQNATLLRAISLGKEATGQPYRAMGTGERGSLIGSDGNSGPNASAVTANGRSGTLAALLGNPAFPTVDGAVSVPAQPRGSMVFQSAGRDGAYLSNNDNGAKRWAVAAGGGTSPTGVQFAPVQNTTSGAIRIDAISDFDDIVVPASN